LKQYKSFTITPIDLKLQDYFSGKSEQSTFSICKKAVLMEITGPMLEKMWKNDFLPALAIQQTPIRP
jgi:hypothetical protein